MILRLGRVLRATACAPRVRKSWYDGYEVASNATMVGGHAMEEQSGAVLLARDRKQTKETNNG